MLNYRVNWNQRWNPASLCYFFKWYISCETRWDLDCNRDLPASELGLHCLTSSRGGREGDNGKSKVIIPSHRSKKRSWLIFLNLNNEFFAVRLSVVVINHIFAAYWAKGAKDPKGENARVFQNVFCMCLICLIFLTKLWHLKHKKSNFVWGIIRFLFIFPYIIILSKDPFPHNFLRLLQLDRQATLEPHSPYYSC